MKELIDLDELKRSAESGEGDVTIVERSWLAQVLEELTLGREAVVQLGEMKRAAGRVFGLQPGQRL